MSQNDATVADLQKQLQEVTVKLSQTEQSKDQLSRRVDDLETTITSMQSFLTAQAQTQANPDVPAPTYGTFQDKSSCNSKQTPDIMHE